MQLVAAIHHPGVRLRPPDDLLADLAATYDAAYGQPSRRLAHDLGHSLLLMLDWPEVRLDFPTWTPTDAGLLATLGTPLLDCPPSGDSQMLTPPALARRLADAAAGRSDALANCGGYFGAALAAGSKDEPGPLHLMTNYLGEVPLYRASRQVQGHTLTVWSNKAAAAAMLAGVERDLDEQAACEFVLLGHVLDGRTLYRHVQAEPPATTITLDGRGVTRRGYLDLPGAYFERRLPPKEVARQTAAGLGPLVDALRQSDAPNQIHLTGGMDSRAVAAIFKHHGHLAPCTTHGTPNEEVPAARALAKALGMPYHTMDGADATEEAFFAHAEPSLWQSDGMMSLKYLAGRYDLALIRDEGYIPIEGLGGEFGRGYFFGTAESFDKLRGGDFAGFWGKMLGGRGQRWPDPQAVQALRGRIEASLTQAQDAGLDACQATTWFYVNQRVRHWGAVRRQTGWTWIIDPLKMPCWTMPAMAAEPTEQAGERLIRAVIEHAEPRANRVPTVPELARRARVRRVASNRLVRTAMKIYDAVRPPDSAPVMKRGLGPLQPALSEVLERGRSCLDALLPPEVARGFLDDQPWTYDQTELFWHSVTLAMWCDVFLQRDAPIGACYEVETTVTDEAEEEALLRSRTGSH